MLCNIQVRIPQVVIQEEEEEEKQHIYIQWRHEVTR